MLHFGLELVVEGSKLLLKLNTCVLSFFPLFLRERDFKNHTVVVRAMLSSLR